MEHTKGEWAIETPCGFPYSGLYIVPVIRKDFPCHIAQIRQLREHKEAEANARLIAAAPDLLAACKEYEAAIKMLFDMNPDVEICLGSALRIKQAREEGKAALAKATT